MTVKELIEKLQAIKEQDMQVRIADDWDCAVTLPVATSTRAPATVCMVALSKSKITVVYIGD